MTEVMMRLDASDKAGAIAGLLLVLMLLLFVPWYLTLLMLLFVLAFVALRVVGNGRANLAAAVDGLAHDLEARAKSTLDEIENDAKGVYERLRAKLPS